MKIVIVGAGRVGQALGAGWRRTGHAVAFAVRDVATEKAKALAAGGFRVIATSGAASDADVALLAVPWGEIPAVIEALGPLSGKILVDATNPLTPELELALGFDVPRVRPWPCLPAGRAWSRPSTRPGRRIWQRRTTSRQSRGCRSPATMRKLKRWCASSLKSSVSKRSTPGR